MMQDSGYFKVGDGELHYLKWGSGQQLLLAFHGYGDNPRFYDLLQPYLAANYTVICFDLPHHGHSVLPDGFSLSKSDLHSLILDVKEEFTVEKVSLIGYSIGGMVCLSCIEAAPDRIDRVLLLATDGLAVNRYFYFFTSTFFGKIVFAHMLTNPRIYLLVMAWLRNIRFAQPARYKFATHFLQSNEHRKRLRLFWPAMRRVATNPAKLTLMINKYRIPVTIFMGANDRVLPPALAQKFMSGLDTVHLHILDKGHRILDQENAQQIAECLL